MYLDEILTAQKRGEARGIVSICSAHPWVIKAAMRGRVEPLLIEATCHQVNQFGGYTGMTPADFVLFISGIAKETDFPITQLILGGDHLGPDAWKNEPAAVALEKSKALIREYVRAGFTKIHLDTSMRLGNDPEGGPGVEEIARRTAMLARCAEESAPDARVIRYVIGTEVPTAGGAQTGMEESQTTTVEGVEQTLDATHRAFLEGGLESAWERVSAVVVNPGVEFGDGFVKPYIPDRASAISKFIETQPLVYEAHSTDYQAADALRNMVRDHFAILKVGPALTHAFREAIVWLATIEEELVPVRDRSKIVAVLEAVMLENPQHWRGYYHGSPAQLAQKRTSSLSDRIRYYWPDPRVQQALNHLMANLSHQEITSAFMQLYGTEAVTDKLSQDTVITSERIIIANIRCVLYAYDQAVVE
jgi:D-tagatose-1,6-bisphosphate aldolase subunit GatZ/KbaZ